MEKLSGSHILLNFREMLKQMDGWTENILALVASLRGQAINILKTMKD